MRAVNCVAILDVPASGKITFASLKAKALVSKYFGSAERLPEAVIRCLTAQAAEALTVPLMWKVERVEEQLIVRVVGREEGHFQLLLEERGDLLTPARLRQALKLTPRESEVLFWIVRGKTSPEIAGILSCMPATVAKHTERIFAKLGVETRTAAAAMAREVAY